jgi:hypothetical protein
VLVGLRKVARGLCLGFEKIVSEERYMMVCFLNTVIFSEQ